MNKLIAVWKVAGWLGKAVAAGLIVSFLSIWTTGYIVNSYVESLLKQYHIPIETQPFALSGVWGSLWGAEEQNTPQATTEETSGSGSDAGAGAGNADKQSSGTGSSDGTDASGSIAGENGDTGGLDDDPGNVADGASADDSNSAEGDLAGDSGNTGGTVADGPGGAADQGAGAGTTGDGTDPASIGGVNNEGEDSPLAVDAYGDLDDGALTDIGGGSGPKGGSAAASDDDSGAEAGESGGTDDTTAGDDSAVAGSTADGANSGGAGSDGATNGTGTADGSAASEASKDGLAMSTDELSEAKDRISDADKEQLFGLMMRKLPQTALQTISGLMEDGLTDTELTQAQQILAQYLNRDEYDEMMGIMKKY